MEAATGRRQATVDRALMLGAGHQELTTRRIALQQQQLEALEPGYAERSMREYEERRVMPSGMTTRY